MATDWLNRFVEDRLISEDGFKEAEGMARSLGIPTEDALVRLEYVDEHAVLEAKSRAFGFDFVDLKNVDVPPDVIKKVPESIARKYNAIPVEIEGDRIVVASSDPMNFEVTEKLRFILHSQVKMVMASKTVILNILNRLYGQGSYIDFVDSITPLSIPPS